MKKILIALSIAMIALLVVGSQLPDEYSVQRSLSIAAEPAEVMQQLRDLGSWSEWSAWSKERDPQAEWTVQGDGVGAILSWEGPVLGSVRMTLSEIVDVRKFAYGLERQDGEFPSEGWLLLEATTEGTLVTWVHRGDLDGLSMRWYGLFFDSALGDELERGLQGLQARVAPTV